MIKDYWNDYRATLYIGVGTIVRVRGPGARFAGNLLYTMQTSYYHEGVSCRKWGPMPLFPPRFRHLCRNCPGGGYASQLDTCMGTWSTASTPINQSYPKKLMPWFKCNLHQVFSSSIHGWMTGLAGWFWNSTQAVHCQLICSMSWSIVGK